jgi:hypothetical protein
MLVSKRLWMILGLVFIVALGITGAVVAQYDPYAPVGFGFVSTDVDPALVSIGSDEASDAPGGIDIYLASLRGLPSNVTSRFIAAYDLVGGGRLYRLSQDTLDSLGYACERIDVYKVNRDGTASLFTNTYCEDGVLYIQHNSDNATFILLRN